MTDSTHLLGRTILVIVPATCGVRRGWLGVAGCWVCILKAPPSPCARRCKSSCTS